MSTITTPLKHLVRYPNTAIEKPSLIILLHGVGSNEADLFSFSGQLPGEFLVVSAQGPYSIGPNRYAWYQVDFSTGKPVINPEQEAASRKAIAQFIDDLKSQYTFDASRVYLLGFSQGAIMSYSVALTYPGKVKGVIAMSGRLLEDIKPQVKPNASKDLQVLITHGTQDQMLGITYAREANAYLHQIGASTTLHEYNAGHGISPEMLKDVVEWLK